MPTTSACWRAFSASPSRPVPQPMSRILRAESGTNATTSGRALAEVKCVMLRVQAPPIPRETANSSSTRGRLDLAEHTFHPVPVGVLFDRFCPAGGGDPLSDLLPVQVERQLVEQVFGLSIRRQMHSVLEPLASRLAHPPPQVGIIQQPGDLAARSTTGSPGSQSRPVTPSLTVYGTPPIRLAMTGMPDAIASTDVMLSPSWAIVGTRQMSAAR